MDSSGSKPRNPLAHPRRQRIPCWVCGRRAGRCMLPPLMSSNLPGTPMLQINSKFNFVPTPRQLHLSRPPLPFSALVQGAGGNSFSEPVETRKPMETNPLHSASCGLGWVLPIDRVSRTMYRVSLSLASSAWTCRSHCTVSAQGSIDVVSSVNPLPQRLQDQDHQSGAFACNLPLQARLPLLRGFLSTAF